MKKLFLLFLLLASVFQISAKDEPVNLSFLKQDPNIKIYIDYDNAKLDGITFEYLDSVVKANSDVIYERFIYEMEKKASGTGLKFGLFKSAHYFMRVQVKSVDEDGALKAKVSVIDIQNVSLMASFSVRAHGGISGPFDELLREAVARLGENIADYVIEHL